MQLLTLELSYFGPYQEAKIDFNEFSDSQLFLISGKTGSGKTTIFDAMSFALYGETSGSDRRGEDLRSEFASEKEVTQVKLVFEHHDLIYTIMRQPAYFKTKRGGQGLTKVGAKVELTYEDELGEFHSLDKAKEIKAKLEEIIPLTAKQFRQVIVLPQGQFRNFLEADSNAKEVVLKEIFDTQIYADLGQVIARKTKEIRDKSDAQAQKVELYQKSVYEKEGLAPSVEYGLWFERVQARLAELKASQQEQAAKLQNVESQKEQLREAIARKKGLLADFQALKQAQAESEKLVQEEAAQIQQNRYLDQLLWAQKQAPLWQKVCDQRQSIQVKNEQLAQLDQKWQILVDEEAHLVKQANQLASLASQAEDKEILLSKLAGKEELYDKYQGQTIQLEQQLASQATEAQKVKATAERLENGQNILTKIKADLNQKRAELMAVNHNQADLANLRLQAQTTANYQMQGQELQALADDLAQQKQAWQQKAEQVPNLKAEVQKKTAAVQVLKKQLAQNIAASLAEDLQEDNPCPVCGSLNHPHLAQRTDEISQAIIEQAEKNQQVAQSQFDRLQATTNRDKAEWQSEVKRYAGKLTNFQEAVAMPAVALEEILSALKQKYVTLSKQVTELEAQEEIAVTLQAEISALEVKQVKCEQLWQDLTVEHQVNQATFTKVQLEVKALEGQMVELKANLLPEYPDKEAFVRYYQDLQAEVIAYQEEKQAYENRQQTFNQEKAEVTSLRQAKQAELVDLEKESQTQANALAEVLETADFKVGLSDLENLLKNLEQIDSLQVAKTQFAVAKKTNQENLARLQEKLGSSLMPDTREDEAQLAAYNEELDTGQAVLGQLVRRLENLQESYQQVQAIHESSHEILEQLNRWSYLNEAINGSGRRKDSNSLSLERFALQQYFQQVLAEANRIFTRLSHGRYSFLLKDGQDRSAKHTGLELNVVEAYSGKQRSVNTLSGGEGFMAALSLALGLGKVIQIQNGGLQLGALFIDEGFGSLDQESLDTAILTLQNLEGDHRMIGIISHVSELKERIADQLQVTADQGQSHLQVIHGRDRF
ncbi:MAG: SMC family ATPase [Ligilactobacillus sp.]|nr:SMC family ATPase [Ligilactobacillus sp.]